jgi:hypothetical protein
MNYLIADMYEAERTKDLLREANDARLRTLAKAAKAATARPKPRLPKRIEWLRGFLRQATA